MATITTNSCNDTFSITVYNQDGYWPKKLFFDRNGNGTGTDYNTIYTDDMSVAPLSDGTYPKYHRRMKVCEFSDSSSNPSYVTDYFTYIDKADYLASNGNQMTTMNYSVESEYKCCFYLMVDAYDAYTWENNTWSHIHGDCATIYKDCFYIDWVLSLNQRDMIMGMHIPLSARYFSYDSTTGLINNTANANGFSEVYEGITTYANHMQNPSTTGLRGIDLHVQSNTMPNILYITYTVSRYKRLINTYEDNQIVFTTYTVSQGKGKITCRNIHASHVISPCLDYDVATDSSSTPVRPWFTSPEAILPSNYTYQTKTLNKYSGSSVVATTTLHFLVSGQNFMSIAPNATPVYRIDMVVTIPTSDYTTVLTNLTKYVDANGDGDINTGDIFYDMRDGQIKQRMGLIPNTPDRIYDSSHVFYDNEVNPNVIGLVDCDNEGNEEIRSVLPNDPDYIGVSRSLTVDNHGMFKFVSSNNNVLYTFFKNLRMAADGIVTWYRFVNGDPVIDCEWTDASHGTYSINNFEYDASWSSSHYATIWGAQGSYYGNTHFPDYYGSTLTQQIYIYAYSSNVVDIDTTQGIQIIEYTYDSVSGVASITVLDSQQQPVVYTLASDDYDTQIDYYERQTEYVMFEGTADTSNALAPSTVTDRGVNKTYCPEEGKPYTLSAFPNYGGHVLGWLAINGGWLSSNEQINTSVACCNVITPVVEYGYERPFYYYVIKNNEYTYDGSYNPKPLINTYGLKRCDEAGYYIYNFLRYVNDSVGFVPRKTAIFGNGTSGSGEYVDEDALQSVYVGLVKISDDYLIHDNEGNVIGLPNDLSCADIIYGGDGLSAYMKDGYIDDGSVYIFVYARPTVSVSGNTASYNVLYGAGATPSLIQMSYTIKSLAQDDSYTVSHDTFYQSYLQAPLFTIVTNATNLGGSCGTFKYNNEVIASFTHVIYLADNFGYVRPNSYLNYTDFVDTWGGRYRASAVDYSDGILYYDVSQAKSEQVLYLNSYFFTKQCKIQFSEFDYTSELVQCRPYSFHYVFNKIDSGSTTQILKYVSSNINKLTRWLPQGTCVKGYVGNVSKTIDGKRENTIMFNEVDSEDLPNLFMTITFPYISPVSETDITLTFSLKNMSETIYGVLTSTSTTVSIQDSVMENILSGSIYKDNGFVYINNLKVNNNSVYGLIRLIQMDGVYAETYYESDIAGYTFAYIGIGNGLYSDITIYDTTDTKDISVSIVNGWSVIHTFTEPLNVTGTDGCGVDDEDYIAKIWPYTLVADGQSYAETMRIKIFGYTPNIDDWDDSTDDNIEQNLFLCFTVKTLNTSSYNPSGSYDVKIKFYDIVRYYFTRYTANPTTLPLYIRCSQITDSQPYVPYYLPMESTSTPPTNMWYISENSGENYIEYTVGNIAEALVSYIDFDEDTYEVILKDIFGDVRVETSWKFGVYKSYFTANDSSNNIIYYYSLSTPIILKSEIESGNSHIPGYAGFDIYSSAWTGCEWNRTFDEVADRYGLYSSTDYSVTVPNIVFNIDANDLMLYYAGYNNISPNTLYIPHHTDLGRPMCEFSFGNIDNTGSDYNGDKVVLRQSSRYAYEGISYDTWSVGYNAQNSLFTSYTCSILGNGGGRYLQLTTAYSENRRMAVEFPFFGTIYFIIQNHNVTNVLCDFKDYLTFGNYNDIDDYQDALNALTWLKIMVYYFTDTDNTTKYVFEIGPLPSQILDNTVHCRWNHNNGENYYYNAITGTQNFILGYRYIDNLTSNPSNIILNFHTVNTDANCIFKGYNDVDSSSIWNAYDVTTVEYNES